MRAIALDRRRSLLCVLVSIGAGLVPLEPQYVFPTAFVGGPNLFGQRAELGVALFGSSQLCVAYSGR